MLTLVYLRSSFVAIVQKGKISKLYLILGLDLLNICLRKRMSQQVENV